MFSPSVKYIASYEERSGGEVNNSGIQSFGGFLTQLLCGFGADGALGL